MKIQLLSDLHLECERPNAEEGKEFYHYTLPVAAEYLALLGDVGCTFQEELFVWLRAQLPKFEKIFFVAGNHGGYIGRWRQWRILTRDLPAEPYRSSIVGHTHRLLSPHLV